jgi:hypothetical protein
MELSGCKVVDLYMSVVPGAGFVPAQFLALKDRNLCLPYIFFLTNNPSLLYSSPGFSHLKLTDFPQSLQIANARISIKSVNVSGMSRACSIDVLYLIRYGAYTGHIRGIYGASSNEP